MSEQVDNQIKKIKNSYIVAMGSFTNLKFDYKFVLVVLDDRLTFIFEKNDHTHNFKIDLPYYKLDKHGKYLRTFNLAKYDDKLLFHDIENIFKNELGSVLIIPTNFNMSHTNNSYYFEFVLYDDEIPKINDIYSLIVELAYLKRRELMEKKIEKLKIISADHFFLKYLFLHNNSDLFVVYQFHKLIPKIMINWNEEECLAIIEYIKNHDLEMKNQNETFSDKKSKFSSNFSFNQIIKSIQSSEKRLKTIERLDKIVSISVLFFFGLAIFFLTLFYFVNKFF